MDPRNATPAVKEQIAAVEKALVLSASGLPRTSNGDLICLFRNCQVPSLPGRTIVTYCTHLCSHAISGESLLLVAEDYPKLRSVVHALERYRGVALMQQPSSSSSSSSPSSSSVTSNTSNSASSGATTTHSGYPRSSPLPRYYYSNSSSSSAGYSDASSSPPQQRRAIKSTPTPSNNALLLAAEAPKPRPFSCAVAELADTAIAMEEEEEAQEAARRRAATPTSVSQTVSMMNSNSALMQGGGVQRSLSPTLEKLQQRLRSHSQASYGGPGGGGGGNGGGGGVSPMIMSSDPVMDPSQRQQPSSSSQQQQQQQRGFMGVGFQSEGDAEMLRPQDRDIITVNGEQFGVPREPVKRGTQLKGQMIKYGLKLFRQDRRGNWVCFFRNCDLRMAANFSRHILKHERQGDSIDPQLLYLANPAIQASYANTTTTPSLPSQLALNGIKSQSSTPTPPQQQQQQSPFIRPSTSPATANMLASSYSAPKTPSPVSIRWLPNNNSNSRPSTAGGNLVSSSPRIFNPSLLVSVTSAPTSPVPPNSAFNYFRPPSGGQTLHEFSSSIGANGTSTQSQNLAPIILPPLSSFGQGSASPSPLLPIGGFCAPLAPSPMNMSSFFR